MCTNFAKTYSECAKQFVGFCQPSGICMVTAKTYKNILPVVGLARLHRRSGLSTPSRQSFNIHKVSTVSHNIVKQLIHSSFVLLFVYEVLMIIHWPSRIELHFGVTTLQTTH